MSDTFLLTYTDHKDTLPHIRWADEREQEGEDYELSDYQ